MNHKVLMTHTFPASNLCPHSFTYPVNFILMLKKNIDEIYESVILHVYACLQSYVAPCLKRHLGNIQLREANGVHDYIKERTIKIGNHVVETRETVRMIAKKFGVSKSTVHKDLTERLPEINPLLASRVKEILEYHKSIRHIRGGEATRKKYKRGKQAVEAKHVTH